MSNVNYRIESSTEDYMLIKDIGPWDRFMTITNAAEEVVKELAPRLAGRRLFYTDSENAVDELLVQNGSFAGFKFGGPSVRDFFANYKDRFSKID
jgi:hypothetical protein